MEDRYVCPALLIKLIYLKPAFRMITDIAVRYSHDFYYHITYQITFLILFASYFKCNGMWHRLRRNRYIEDVYIIGKILSKINLIILF